MEFAFQNGFCGWGCAGAPSRPAQPIRVCVAGTCLDRQGKATLKCEKIHRRGTAPPGDTGCQPVTRGSLPEPRAAKSRASCGRENNPPTTTGCGFAGAGRLAATAPPNPSRFPWPLNSWNCSFSFTARILARPGSSSQSSNRFCAKTYISRRNSVL